MGSSYFCAQMFDLSPMEVPIIGARGEERGERKHTRKKRVCADNAVRFAINAQRHAAITEAINVSPPAYNLATAKSDVFIWKNFPPI